MKTVVTCRRPGLRLSAYVKIESSPSRVSSNLGSGASLRLFLPIAVVFALLLSACRTREVKSAGPPPPVPVTVAVATEESIPEEIHAFGGVEPSATVQIKSQIAGELTARSFH